MIEPDVVQTNSIPASHARMRQDLVQQIQLVLAHRIRMDRDKLIRYGQVRCFGRSEIPARVQSIAGVCSGQDGVVESRPPRVRLDTLGSKLREEAE